MTSKAVERVLDRLTNVTKHAHGDGIEEWTATCPGHADRHPSLDIREGSDGRALLICRAGCATDRIVTAIGLDLADLFEKDAPSGVRRTKGEGGVISPPTHDQHCTTTQEPTDVGCTLGDYARLKQLSLDALRSYGLSEIWYMGAPAIRVPYFDEQGQPVATRFRTALVKPSDGPDNRFKWKRGAKPCLYGLWRVDEARAAGCIALVEGESDTHCLWQHGIPALGVPGAGNWREERDAPQFEGIEEIFLVIEPDQGGDTLVKALAQSRLRDKVCLVRLDDGLKDVAEMHVADPERFMERWEAAVAAAVPLADKMVREAEEVAETVWALCAELAHTKDILAAFVTTSRDAGLIGEDRNAQILYLALVSRLLPRPVSVAVKGPSSGGKSFTVDSVLKFFPGDAFYALTAMSDRALAYDDEPLAHRFLVVFEATGMAGDMASYLMRSLLSEGRVRYVTIEKTRDGLRPRTIERQGPTGLIVTTTAVRLHPENETRLISLTVTDSRDQTAAVLQALAGQLAQQIDYAPWRALQEWLTSAEHRVVIPYAATLAAAIPPVAVRLRRDFGALLALVRAHAILHQASREKDEQGQIVATEDDYAAVRALVADLVAEGVEATVAPTVRETVAAVRAALGNAPDATVSVTAVARHLKLDRSAASRRINAAIDRGFLKNLAEKRGQPARICLGDALPDDVPVLPSVESLHGAKLCSDAGVSAGISIPLSPSGISDSDARHGTPASPTLTGDSEGSSSPVGSRDTKTDGVDLAEPPCDAELLWEWISAAHAGRANGVPEQVQRAAKRNRYQFDPFATVLQNATALGAHLDQIGVT